MTDSAAVVPPETPASSQTIRDSALSLVRSWQAPSAEQDKVRRDYVRHLEQHPDGLLRECLPDHITASTLIVSADREQVLLTLHAKAKAWFQMGGHCEAGDRTLASAALREAVEESGIEDLAIDADPLQLSTHDVPFCHPSGRVRHLDVRFLAIAPWEAAHAVSEESLDVRWWPIERLPSAEPGLLELVRFGRARLAGQSTTSSLRSFKAI